MTLEEARAVRGRFIRGENVEQRLVAQADAVIALSKPARTRAGQKPRYTPRATELPRGVLAGAIVDDGRHIRLCAVEVFDFKLGTGVES